MRKFMREEKIRYKAVQASAENISLRFATAEARDGARLLLRAQRPEGHWRDPENHELATSFALLFLARKTLGAVTPRDRDIVITPGTGQNSAPK